MTTRADYKNEGDFNADDEVEEEADVSTITQVSDAVGMITAQLRRATVFLPIFGIVFLGIGALWFQSVRAESSVSAQSSSIRIQLDQPSPQPDVLLQEADGWDTAYQVVLNDRTARPDDSELIGHVISAAENAGMVVIETGTTDDGQVTLASERYIVTPVLLKATGTMTGVQRFMTVLETPEFAAFEIQASMLSSETVGYQLTLKGIFYSLPKTFGDEITAGSGDIPVIPVGATSGLEVSP
jgi:hypothetical protein